MIQTNKLTSIEDVVKEMLLLAGFLFNFQIESRLSLLKTKLCFTAEKTHHS